MPLTLKQQRFVEEYLLDLNATAAAKRAGYSEKTAGQQGERLLRNAEIADAVAEAQAQRSQRTEVDADRVLRELAVIGFLDPADLATVVATSGPGDIPKLPERVRRAIVGWNWDKAGNFTLKLAPKTTALEMIGRHLAMFTDKTNTTHEAGESVRALFETLWNENSRS